MSDAPSTAAALPPAGRLLFWSPSEQDAGYPHLDRVFPSRTIARGPRVRPLPPAAAPLDVRFAYDHRPYTTADVFKVNRTSAVLVLGDGRIALERYAAGRTADERWPSFSVAKSVTSTLVGLAVADGAIAGVDDPVTRYLPELAGTAYDGVTLHHLLTMASGAEWTEDYDDPASDRAVSGFLAGPDLIAAMATKRRVAAPGAAFHYKTADTGILGAVVARATGRTLADYLSQRIWSRCGMEADASWILHGDDEVAGTCLSARLRDMARFGLFVLDDGVIDGERVLPAGWLAAATAGHLPTPYGDTRYGYQWWVHADGSFEAAGIMGQSLRIDPASRTVIVIQSAWNNAGTDPHYRLQRAFQDAVLAAVRAGRGSGEGW